VIPWNTDRYPVSAVAVRGRRARAGSISYGLQGSLVLGILGEILVSLCLPSCPILPF